MKLKAPRKLAIAGLFLISGIALLTPIASWLLEYQDSQNLAGPLTNKYFTVDAGGGGPGDTTVVTPRTPHQYLGRTSGPSLSGTDFRFPPMGEKIEKTTSITSIQVNFNVTTPTDSRVTLRFSHPKNHTEQLGDFETHAGKPQSILYVKNFENSTRSFILYAGDLAFVGLVSNSSYMWIDTDSTIWLTLREANVVPPGNIWTQYEQESVLSFLGAFAASAGSSLLVAPILKRRSGRLRRASASQNDPAYLPE